MRYCLRHCSARGMSLSGPAVSSRAMDSIMKPAPHYILAIAMALPAALIGIEIPSWFLLPSRSLALQSDFGVFYTPGYMVRTHQVRDIYDFGKIRRNQSERVSPDSGAVPFLHPAYESLLFVPLSLLPYRIAYLVWAAVNFAVLAGVYLVLRPRLAHFSVLGPAWILPTLLLGFIPTAFAILAGQDSLLLVLILALAFRRVESNEFLAGLLLGLGMFRFQVLLPIVLLLLLWRRVRLVAGWITSSAAVLSASAAITGIRAQVQYLSLLRQMGGALSYWPLLRRMPNLHGLFAALGFGKVALVLVSAALAAAVAVIGWRQKAQQQFLFAISASCLVTYYIFLHDLSVLALPILVSMDGATAKRSWRRWMMIAAVSALFAVLWFAPDNFCSCAARVQPRTVLPGEQPSRNGAG